MFMKYSQNQLEVIQRSIQEALKEKLNKDERWCYLNNLSKVNSEIEKLKADLPENDSEYQQYVNESVQLAIEHGAKAERTQQGITITDWSTIEDREKYDEAQTELNKKYEDAIERQQKINEEVKEKRSQEIAEIEWKTIDFGKIENSSEKVLNEHTMSFITDPT